MRRISSHWAVALCVSVLAGTASADVIFQDTFDRADSRNIDGALDGINNNTGSVLGIDGVYTHAFIDPANADPTNGVQDGDAVNGGGAQILNHELQLAVGSGTSNAFVNHNFLNTPSFSVSLDVTGNSQNTVNQGGLFAIGMTLDEAGPEG